MADLIDTIKDLIAVCLHSQEGFGRAANGVHSDNLRNRFLGIARQRVDFAGELAGHVREAGGYAAGEPRQSGPQHRGWRQLETSIRPKEDADFIAECQMGEENTLRHYETALTRNLPPKVRATVERQRLGVQEALLELRIVEQVRTAR
jgi:uncharacterized protein (TIGR02284 family)